MQDWKQREAACLQQFMHKLMYGQFGYQHQQHGKSPPWNQATSSWCPVDPKPKIKENEAGINVIKFWENPDKLNGVTSLLLSNFAKKKIPENKNIKGDIFIIIVGVFIKDNKNVFKIIFSALWVIIIKSAVLSFWFDFWIKLSIDKLLLLNIEKAHNQLPKKITLGYYFLVSLATT